MNPQAENRAAIDRLLTVYPLNRVALFLLLIFLAVSVSGCSYLRTVFKQTHYSLRQKLSPRQRVYKHMLQVDNFFVFGKIENGSDLNKDAIAVVALSDLHRENEVVDISHSVRIGSYYALNLPEGEYHVLVVSDLNRDGFYDGTEILGGKSLFLSRAETPEKVLGGFDIDLNLPFPSNSAVSFRRAVQQTDKLTKSLFYPKGTIRSLDDRIFSTRMTTLGLMEPAAFLEKAPMMFYALEEDVGYKVPVIFVHGIGGTVRDFEDLVAGLDRSLYRPLFFYYPSGCDLSQLGEMFYTLFLSGKVLPLEQTPVVIVAHSMGGLVARDAMNRLTGRKGEARTARLITIAGLMGGHPDAKMGAKAPVVIPSWRDVDPGSDFMRRLRRRPLPKNVEYHLIYTYGNSRIIKLGENSDGVVPLSSQLCTAAQDEATGQYGFNDDHTGILKNPDAIRLVIKLIGEVKPPYPEEHLRELVKGGYEVYLGKDYSPREKYFINTIGIYMDALVSEAIEPLPVQLSFIKACRGEKAPDNEAETAWIKFNRDYPDRHLLK